MPRSEPMLGVVSTRWPPGFRMRLISAHQVHGIFEQMLDQLAAEHGIESIRRRKESGPSRRRRDRCRIEGLAVGGVHGALVDAARLAVVAAAHFAIAELGFERRRDLQVRAHFENAVAGAAGRRDFERFLETREVRFEYSFACSLGAQVCI